MKEKCLTVGELRWALAHLSGDTPIISCGPDVGGYDVSATIGVSVEDPEDRFADHVWIGETLSEKELLNKHLPDAIYLTGTDEDVFDFFREKEGKK